MGQSLKKYHHFRSYRLKVPKKDYLTLRLSVDGHEYPVHINDINLTGLSFGIDDQILKSLSAKIRLEIATDISLILDHKKFFKHKKIATKAQIIRKFTLPTEDDYHFFGVNFLNESSQEMREFIEYYLEFYDPKKLKKYLIESSINESQSSEFEHIEFLSLFRELINDYFSEAKQEDWDEAKSKLLGILPYKDILIWLVHPESGELRPWPENAKYEHSDILNTVRNTEAPIHFKSVMPEGVVRNLKHKASSSYPLFHKVKHEDEIFFGVIQFVYRQREYSNEDEILTSLLTNMLANKMSLIHISDRATSLSIARHSIKHHSLGHTNYAKWLEEVVHKEANTLMPLTLIGEAYCGQEEVYQYLQKHFNYKNNEIFTIDFKQSSNLLSEQALKNAQGIFVIKNITELNIQDQEKTIKLFERIKGKIIFESSYSLENSPDLHPKLKKMISDNVVLLKPLKQRQDEIPFIARSMLINHCKEHNYPTKILSQKAHQYLHENPPENTQQLKELVISWFNAQVNDQIIGPVNIYAIKDGNQIRQLLNHGLTLEDQIKLLKLSLWSFDKEGNYSH